MRADTRRTARLGLLLVSTGILVSSGIGCSDDGSTGPPSDPPASSAGCVDYTTLLHRERGFTNGRFLGSVAVRGDIAFAAYSDGLRALRANGDELEEVGRFDAYAVAVRLRGDYAYVASDREIDFVDVTDPTLLTGGLALEIPFSARRLEVGTRYGVASGVNEFLILDFFQPQEPTIVAARNLGATVIRDLALSGRTLFFATDAGLFVYQLGDELYPEEIAHYGDEPVRAIALRSGLLAATLEDRGLTMLDVTNPEAPEELGEGVPIRGETAAVALTSTRVYVGANGGAHVYSHESGEHLTLLGFAATGDGFPAEWLESGGDLYLANGGLEVLRPGGTVPKNPVEIATDADLVHVDGNLVVTATSKRVVGLDLSDPAAPRETFSFEAGAPVLEFALDERAVWVATELALEEWILDGDAVSPGRVLEIGPPIDAVDTDGTRVYVSSATELVVVDPAGSELEVVGHVPTAWLGGDLVAGEGVVYISQDRWGFQVFDVTDPSSPSLLASRGFTPNPSAVAASAERGAVVVSIGDEVRFLDPLSSEGTRVLDAAIFTSPVLDLAFVGSFVYVATEEGIDVLEFSDDADAVRVAGVPWPVESGPGRLYVGDRHLIAVGAEGAVRLPSHCD